MDYDEALHISWLDTAMVMAYDFAEAYCNHQCDDQQDRLHELNTARRALREHLMNQPASMSLTDPELRAGIELQRREIDRLREAVAAEREAANNAYRERNQLVALLSTLFSSGKAKTAIEGWDEAWHGCVYIDFPWGQASWHYHINDEWMFEHLPPYMKAWDGHTTEAKYAEIAKAIRARGEK